MKFIESVKSVATTVRQSPLAVRLKTQVERHPELKVLLPVAAVCFAIVPGSMLVVAAASIVHQTVSRVIEPPTLATHNNPEPQEPQA